MAARRELGRNDALAELLDELGWSPKALAQKVNRAFGTGTVAESAPYHCRDSGRVPRQPLPSLVASLLSDALGRTVRTDELWPGERLRSAALLPASVGLDRPWTPTALGEIVQEWITGGLRDRRR